MPVRWSIPAPVPYAGWRVQSPDGIWHRVEWYMFHYSEPPRNRNWTYCGLQLNDPPFEDLAGHNYPWQNVPEPQPPCVHCANLSRAVRR